MDLGRIELPYPLCKSGVLPLNYRPCFFMLSLFFAQGKIYEMFQ